MKIDTAGNYILRYTAEDDCGNIKVADRTLKVLPPPRTVIYSDGTLIINEQGEDRERNLSLHGSSRAEYNVFNPNGITNAEKYIFSNQDQAPWHLQYDRIVHVEIGDNIAPFDLSYWFYRVRYCQDMDLTKLNTSNVEKMHATFFDCMELASLDLSNFNTEQITDMSDAFNGCSNMETIDLSSFNTQSVTTMHRMIYYCSKLQTIYASNNFVTTQVTSSSDMFSSMSTNLVGGSGTTWASNKPKDKTYAHIDGGTSNPGYFTAKPTA